MTLTNVKKQSGYDASMPRTTRDSRREILLRAALEEFAAVGFEGAALRSIARRAGMESGHLTYYARTKDELWKQVVETFAAGLLDRVAAISPQQASTASIRDARTLLHSLLLHFAEQPLLTRVMLHEFSLSTARNRWVLRRFARPVWLRLRPLFTSLQKRGLIRGQDPWMAYFGLVGAAIIYYGSLPELASIRGRGRMAANSPAMIEWLLDGLFATRVEAP